MYFQANLVIFLLSCRRFHFIQFLFWCLCKHALCVRLQHVTMHPSLCQIPQC